jgi:hypothetical protein
MVWQHISLLCWYVYSVEAGWRLKRLKSLHPASTQYTHQHNRLICRHTIDYVTIDVHKKTIYIALAKQWGTPWWWFLREPKHVAVFIVTTILFRVHVTSNVHQLDFNKRILKLRDITIPFGIYTKKKKCQEVCYVSLRDSSVLKWTIRSVDRVTTTADYMIYINNMHLLYTNIMIFMKSTHFKPDSSSSERRLYEWVWYRRFYMPKLQFFLL